MRNVMMVLGAMTMAGCGFTVHSDPVNVNPVTLTVNFDLLTLQKYFTAECQQQLGPDATTEAVTNCTNAAIGSFLSAFATILTPGQSVPSPTPSP